MERLILYALAEAPRGCGGTVTQCGRDESGIGNEVVLAKAVV